MSHLTTSLKNQIINLYNETNENIHGVGFGYKFTNNERTDQIGIIFKVFQKKSVTELDANEILPSSIVIDNESYVTDVIEEPSLPSGLGCYSLNNPTDPEILKLRGVPSLLLPIKGGQEIIRFPHDVVPSSGGGYTASYGTLGLLAIDNHDNNIVGITNAHVACSNFFIASDRTKTTETNSPYNIAEKAVYIPNGAMYYPGSLSISGSGNSATTFISVPRIKRYQPIRKEPAVNYIDCAVTFVDNNIVTDNSYGIHAPSNQPAITTKPPFATMQELDSLLNMNTYLLSTGRTTGPKGWTQTETCKLIPISLGLTISVNFPGKGTGLFTDAIAYAYQDNSAFPAAGGDSGSAVLANIGGTPKILGLLFAAGSNFGILCRIDHIAETLNIRAWQDDHVFNTSSPCGNPYDGISQPPPNNATLSQIVMCDFDDPRSALDSIEINGIKYYQAGCTKTDYPHIDSISSLAIKDETTNNDLLTENNNPIMPE